MKTLSDQFPNATEDQLWELEQMFPEVTSPYDPSGRWCVIQDRGVVEKTKHGIIRPDIVKEADEYQENVGRVLAMGPLAGYDELSADPDPERRRLPGWPYFDLGDIILCSRMSSTRQKIGEANGRKVVFRLIPDRDVMAKIKSIAQVMRND